MTTKRGRLVEELIRNGLDRPAVPLLVTGAAVAAAVWLRLASVFAEFPSGDGGLFWVMAADLRSSGFVPPAFTGYNTGDIPWVYPPLGLYLLALVGGGLEWLRILPAVFAIATLPAFWLLARELVGDRAALVALIAYGLSSSAYLGLIAGGGVTRAPGLLLALLTMWAVVRGHVASAGLLGGMTLLTHPIGAVYGVLASVVLWATRGAAPRMLIAPLIAIAVGALWFVPMIARHGVAPLLSSLGSRDVDLVDNAVLLLAQSINPPNLAFTVGAVGVVVAVRLRRWDLLAWLAITALGAAVVDRWIAIPLAVLAGLAVDAALENLPRMRSVALVAVAAVIAVVGVAFADPPEYLTAGERDVAAWAAANTQPGATFAVIGYRTDRGMVDWFPALSSRPNLTTWQGSEWVPNGGDRRAEASAAARCQSLDCLPEADYYVLRPECCPDLVQRLEQVRDRVYTRPDE